MIERGRGTSDRECNAIANSKSIRRNKSLAEGDLGVLGVMKSDHNHTRARALSASKRRKRARRAASADLFMIGSYHVNRTYD